MLCVDEKSQIQARSQPADAALAPRTGRTAHARLHPPRHHVAAELVEASRQSTSPPARHRQMLPPSSRERVPRLPRPDREGRPSRFRRAPRDGQLRHAKDADGPRLARQTSALARPSHADRSILDQPGRALLRAARQAADQARNPPPRRGPAGRDHGLHKHQQRRSQTISMDENRRRHPRLDRTLLPPDRTSPMPRTSDSGH